MKESCFLINMRKHYVFIFQIEGYSRSGEEEPRGLV